MRLSPLQKYILKISYSKQPKINRNIFVKFYEKQKTKPTKTGMVNIITNSLESLIDKELLVGFGERTAQKWYIKEVKLTPKGRREARKLLGEQQLLPFKFKIRQPAD